MQEYKFRVDQRVEFIASDLRLTPLGHFRIVRVLPIEHGILRYRIKSVTDGHERVVMESELA